ncbi:MAG: biotin/lipoyl-binding protein, partial [Chthoniobacterales bacterium]|nr:biotin/lipoyl-binding protein [Chthoniobacterales bacterium]
MDVPRPDVARKKKKRRLIIGAASLLGLILITAAISRLKPAAMNVDRAAVWVDTVKRGPMLRQVRGLGTLVPEDIRWIATSKEGRVEKIIVRPGARVQPDTIILELSSPDLQQLALDAASAATTAEAELTTLKATLQRELLSQESTTAQVHSEYLQAKMEAETNDNLKKNGLIAELEYKTSIIKRDELQNRDEIENKRLVFARDSIDPQLAAKQATVNQLIAAAKLKARDVEALHVKAGMEGVLQQLPVEVGQRVTPGTNLARVADPKKLKAQIKIA